MWTIQAQKYDGSEHYRLPASLVTDDGDALIFRAQPGGLIVHNTRGTKPIRSRSDFIFWRGAWYNVYLNFREDGVFDHFYCNVGLPPVVAAAEKRLSFVDLDLDVRIWPNGTCRILDTDEFRDHSQRYHYPPDMQRRAIEAMLDVIIRWRARKFPFDRLARP